MTPRWTVDAGRLRWEPDPVVILADASNYEDIVNAGNPDNETAYLDSIRPAYDALVAAVRDADTLRQARDYIRSFANGVPDGMTPSDIVKQLTDLVCWGITPPLLSPAPQGEG